MKSFLASIWDWDISSHDDGYYEGILREYAFVSEIPYKIHQTYHSVRELPEKLACNIEKIKRENPDCVYKLWDDEDIATFIRTNYGEQLYSNYYLKINTTYGAARADLFRYLLIYKEGGLYLDIKSSLDGMSLHSLIQRGNTAILAHWDNLNGGLHDTCGLWSEIPKSEGEYIQWMLLFAPGHPLIRCNS